MRTLAMRPSPRATTRAVATPLRSPAHARTRSWTDDMTRATSSRDGRRGSPLATAAVGVAETFGDAPGLSAWSSSASRLRGWPSRDADSVFAGASRSAAVERPRDAGAPCLDGDAAERGSPRVGDGGWNACHVSAPAGGDAEVGDVEVAAVEAADEAAATGTSPPGERVAPSAKPRPTPSSRTHVHVGRRPVAATQETSLAPGEKARAAIRSSSSRSSTAARLGAADANGAAKTAPDANGFGRIEDAATGAGGAEPAVGAARSARAAARSIRPSVCSDEGREGREEDASVPS